jgi:prepilin-type N-terminal cleavage/methylation domain-containing protein
MSRAAVNVPTRPVRRWPLSSRRGVTLLELLIVLAIIGVLATMAMVGVSDAVKRANLATEANGIEALLRRGRLVARLERRCVAVVTGGRGLAIVPVAHGSAPPADCAGGTRLEERDLGTTLSDGLGLSPSQFFFDRAGGVIVAPSEAREGGGVDVAVTIRGPGVPPRTFILRLLAGTGAISRLG